MSDQSIRHIALVGITGVGKSTLVNVLHGENVAEVNNNVRPCTTRAKKYELAEGGTRYCIWDTRGFSEPSMANETILTRILKFFKLISGAEDELEKLLRSKKHKIDLVVLCIDGKKIGIDKHWKIYNSICAEFRKRRLKMMVVVMQLQGVEDSEWKVKCENAAKSGVVGFPDRTPMEAVPKFEKLDEPGVTECKKRILTVINNTCCSGAVNGDGDRSLRTPTPTTEWGRSVVSLQTMG